MDNGLFAGNLLMSHLLTLEEYAEKNNIDPNYLHLLAAANQLPHSWLLGRIYVDERQVDEWERQRGSEQSFQEER